MVGMRLRMVTRLDVDAWVASASRLAMWRKMTADELLVDDEASDESCHMQSVLQKESFAPAVAPVSFALLLETLARALEQLEDKRRPVVTGLLLRKLRSKRSGIESLTGEMLEALLVTFNPAGWVR